MKTLLTWAPIALVIGFLVSVGLNQLDVPGAVQFLVGVAVGYAVMGYGMSRRHRG